MVRSATKLVTVAAALVVLAVSPAEAASPSEAASPAAGNPLQPGARLYVNPHSTTVAAAHHLRGPATPGSPKADARLLSHYPTATWFTGGTPRKVHEDVAKVVRGARKDGSVPVLVAYNVANRDCGQYSAGGAQSTTEYEAWIDGFAAGIGDAPTAVILEPDGLGLIPNYVSPIDGTSNCSIPGVDPNDRFAQLGYAIDTLKKNPRTAVYLDATHTGWQNVGESAQRLLRAGVQRADGFFLNVSNYQFTANLVAYGTWISSCIALAERDRAADPAAYDFGATCGNQYWNGGPATTWDGAAMDTTQVWRSEPYSGVHDDLAWNTVGVDSRYAAMLGSTRPTTHFVIDTSRNGQGPWTGTLDWCNPPGRGLGLRPTTTTGNPLVDAYLWVKVPGESDGQCDRSGTGADPEWGGIVDPPAGAWFPAQAHQLIALANPTLP
mgnify:CR=1 FL=1